MGASTGRCTGMGCGAATGGVGTGDMGAEGCTPPESRRTSCSSQVMRLSAEASLLKATTTATT
ncbi:MAG: hypothetical protein ACRC75_12090, partial [Olsenella sp.]